MPAIPLLDTDGLVVNVIMAEYTDPPVPGYTFGPEGGQIGWRWTGTEYVQTDGSPIPPPAAPPPSTPQGAPHVID